jgi:hypothetical protein
MSVSMSERPALAAAVPKAGMQVANLVCRHPAVGISVLIRAAVERFPSLVRCFITPGPRVVGFGRARVKSSPCRPRW